MEKPQKKPIITFQKTPSGYSTREQGRLQLPGHTLIQNQVTLPLEEGVPLLPPPAPSLLPPPPFRGTT